VFALAARSANGVKFVEQVAVQHRDFVDDQHLARYMRLREGSAYVENTANEKIKENHTDAKREM